VDLTSRFLALGEEQLLHWDSKFENLRIVGRGGQGVVFRAERSGVDGFRLPVALKAFTPAVYANAAAYETDMRRVASVAMRVGRLQNHHLLDVHNFNERDQIRVMVMEWVNGHDLHHLLGAGTLDSVRARVPKAEWDHLNDVVITDGPQQARIKPGIAIQILRECLAGLASLHRAGVAHGDLKPANVMVKRTGSVKLVDFGSAVDMEAPGSRIAATPAYAAPEILDGAMNSPQSDLASLGYMLVEMLSGRVLFDPGDSIDVLRAAKWSLPDRLKGLFSSDVARNKDLMALCQELVNPDPSSRMGSAEEAHLVWAANLHRQLVKTDLDSEYENDLRVWMESLPPRDLTPCQIAPPRASAHGRATTLADSATLVM
jgi:serine/threonine-protein kinase